MGRDDFVRFLREDQEEEEKAADEIAEKMFRNKELISFHDFSKYIFG